MSQRDSAPDTATQGATATTIGPALPASLRSQLLGLAVLVGVGAVAVGIYGYASRAVGDRDPFIYAQIAKEILAGKRLYSETWIDKPPLALLMYAAPQLVAPRSYQAVAMFCAMTIVVQGLLFAYAFRNSLAAAAACAVLTIFYPLEFGTFTWPSTEHFANLFVSGCLVVALSIARHNEFTIPQCLAAGGLAIAAFHVRQNTVLCGLLPLVAVLRLDRSWNDRMRAIAWMAAGGAIMWGAVLVIVLLLGDWTGYWWALFVYPRIFASLGRAEEMVHLVQFFARTSLPYIMALFGVAALRGRFAVLALTAAVMGMVGCLMTFHNHPHYLVNILPYATLLVGLGTEELRVLGPGFPWLATAAMAIIALPAANGRMEIAAAEPTLFPLVRVAAEADRLASPEATLWVCGPQPSEAIQFASRLSPANKHCWVFQMRSPWKQLLPKPWEEVLQEYLDHPPDVLVVHQGIEHEAHGPITAETPEYLQLLRRLLERFSYRQAAAVEGYVILLRTP